MPTDEQDASTPARETWIDWVPEEGREDALLDAEPLLTRDELVAELQQYSGTKDVNARNIIHWQSIGAIPYPLKERRQGAPRALYPKWMIGTIHQLKSLQNDGYKLREIGPLLRFNTYHTFLPRALTPRQEERQAKRMANRALFPLVEELDPRIRSLARIHERLHGGQITHAEVRLVDDQGKEHAYLFLTGEQHEETENTSIDIVKTML